MLIFLTHNMCDIPGVRLDRNNGFGPSLRTVVGGASCPFDLVNRIVISTVVGSIDDIVGVHICILLGIRLSYLRLRHRDHIAPEYMIRICCIILKSHEFAYQISSFVHISGGVILYFAFHCMCIRVSKENICLGRIRSIDCLHNRQVIVTAVHIERVIRIGSNGVCHHNVAKLG